MTHFAVEVVGTYLTAKALTPAVEMLGKRGIQANSVENMRHFFRRAAPFARMDGAGKVVHQFQIIGKTDLNGAVFTLIGKGQKGGLWCVFEIVADSGPFACPVEFD